MPRFAELRPYRACLFDLYGTLVDIHTDENRPGFWRKVAAWYSDHGAAWEAAPLRTEYLRLCAEETARLQREYPEARVEIDLVPVFRALYEARGAAVDSSLLAETAWFFRRQATLRLRAYAGARELLEALREAGRRVILLSNAQSCFTRPELDLLGLTDCFDRIFISSEVGFQKPDPRLFSAPLRELRLDPADCLMIGNDPCCDVRGAGAVGMDAVYIHSGLSPAYDPDAPALLRMRGMDLRGLKRRLLFSQIRV